MTKPEKKTYSKPVLKSFGRVVSVTAGSTGNAKDGKKSKRGKGLGN